MSDPEAVSPVHVTPDGRDRARPDADHTDPELTGPVDLAARPNVLVAQLERALGAPAAARVCADLLAGADPQSYAAELPYLGGRAARAFLAGDWSEATYWPQVWGARGLRYVWVPDVAPTVVAGLSSEHWRVAEMCVKVAGQRELGEAGDGAARLVRHELPRVRESAVRALGGIGDTEHVEVVREACEDTDPAVRRASAKALEKLVVRLDLA
jgi:HEAT repeat protein